MSQPVPQEAESQVDEKPRVRVYTPTTGCINCNNTFRVLDKEEIDYQVIKVSPEHVALIDELKREAEALGVKSEYPCVNVYYPSTGDEQIWFGFIPDNIKNIKKENEA
ncbi:hypothetical protein FQA45_00210 [Glutamicibacter halophytocola]|uniref:NrdH-redoxin n=1 Tax=Glutamicibacter halophytocola TaxID=1933880 RepID=A0ABX5Y5D3_9MICC|nr:hypothetical protein [Glutamicibacter halophytocola]QDY64857.1 hypothetical protein FQA45_00210 [Glutamicibacter halophytocola]